MDLGAMLDKMNKYDDIFESRGFKHVDGGGIIPWSHKFVHEDGMSADMAGNRWVIYDEVGDIIDEGKNPAELEISMKLIFG